MKSWGSLGQAPSAIGTSSSTNKVEKKEQSEYRWRERSLIWGSGALLASHTKGTFGHFNLKAIILVSELEIPNKRQISVVPLSRGAWYLTLNAKPLYLGAKPKVAWKISCGKMTVVKNTPNSIGLENRRPTMYMTRKTSAKQKFWPTQLVDEVSEGPL